MTAYPVRYLERQRITAELLRAEQQARIEAWQQHREHSHGWGVVCGLEVTRDQSKEPECLAVDGGEAVDPQGRALHNNRQRVISKSGLGDVAKDLQRRMGNDQKNVFLCLRSVRWPDPLAPSGDRCVDECQLVLAAGFADPDEIPEHPLLSAVTIDPLPVDPEQVQAATDLVPLARIGLAGEEPAIDLGTLDASFRRWAGLVGESIESPSGRASLRLGVDPADDLRRFAVAVPDEHGSFSDHRISIDRHRRTHLEGPVVLAGDLRVCPPDALPENSGGNESRDKEQPPIRPTVTEFGAVLEPPEGEPPAARPWSLYRVSRRVDGSHPESLRIEVENPGEDAELQRFQFAVGINQPAKEGPRFVPVLTASADGTVQISDRGLARTNGKPQQGEDKPTDSDDTESMSGPGSEVPETTGPQGSQPGVESSTDGSVAVTSPAQPERVESGDDDPPILVVQRGVIREGPILGDLDDPRFARRLFQESLAGELALRVIGLPKVIVVGNDLKLDYTYVIDNLGTADVSAIQVYQSLYQTPTKADGSGGGFAFPFQDLPSLPRPDPGLQFKIADIIRLKALQSTKPLPFKKTIVDMAPPQQPTLALLAFGTAAVGSTIYTIGTAIADSTPGN